MSIGRNSIITIAGSLANLAIFSALTPTYLKVIGTERYGTVASLLAITMLLTAANFGMGPAITYHVRTLRDGTERQGDLLWTAYLISGAVALILSGALYLIVVMVGQEIVNVSAYLTRDLQQAFLPLTGMALAALLAGNTTALFTARERFTWIASLQVLDASLAMLLPLMWAVFVSTSVAGLITALFLGRVSIFVLGLVLAWGRLLEFREPTVSLQSMKMLFGFGGWAAANSTVELFISAADRLVLSILRGASAVTFYAVPLSVVVRSMMGPLGLINAAYPQMISRAAISREQLVSKLTRVIVALTPGYVMVSVAAFPILKIWISKEFALQAAPALAILAAVFWLEAYSALQMFVVNARGEPRRNFAISIFIAPVYFACLVPAAYWGAATGVALAFTIRSLLFIAMRARAAMTPRPDMIWVLSSMGILALAAIVGSAAIDLGEQLYAILACSLLAAATVLAVLALPHSLYQPFLFKVRARCVR